MERQKTAEMKRSIKFKGRLRNYMYSPILLTILLVFMNIPIYFYHLEAGFVTSAFTLVYFVIVTVNYQKNKPFFVNELINFATQYGTVQRKLLNEFDIAYALIDYNGRILWVNEGRIRNTTNPLRQYLHILQKKFWIKIERSPSCILPGEGGNTVRSLSVSNFPALHRKMKWYR